ncbi:MAG TPA: SusD/RagB family nutrient-binding outer membrane lipoprotein, partial [Ferruginibacter sp.]|nr:SusD/RagB family nutrient-binding outer membrane lipoprotein [Ferruginibacter sp.]
QLIKWIQFANTLKLRMILHLYNGANSNNVVPGFDVPGEIAKIEATDDVVPNTLSVPAGQFYIQPGQSAHINPGFTSAKPTPYWRVWNTNESGSGSQRDWARASDYAIGYYTYNGDVRISRFYVAPAGGHQGIVFGTPSGPAAPIGSDLSSVRGPGLATTASDRGWIFTSVESLFLQAEARERGIITQSTMPALTRAAMRESFVWLGLTAAAADNLININLGFPDVDPDAGGGLFTIYTQKWFALNSIAPYEIWTDYRRMDYVLGAPVGYDAGPTLSVDPGRTSTVIPRRLFYPQSEYNYNPTNVAGEGTINVFTGKIFWDLN